MRKYISIRLLAAIAAIALAGCSNKPAEDPTMSDEHLVGYANSRFFVAKEGQPFVVDGCQVQIHAVRVTRPGTMSNGSFTLATAKCPTAQVTATHENCGKNCEQDTLRVEAVAPTTAQQEAAQREEAARQLAKQKAELKSRMDKLEEERAQAAAQLEELEQTLPN